MKNNSLVLLQARFNSSRLPGKALLPINGIPIVIISALRAGNTGKKVIVLTSDNKSDDQLCKVLNKYNIDYFRGDLDNTLKRFYSYVKELKDNTIIFRLTADNVLPDGNLLDEMEKDFIENEVDIVGCTPNISNLPYGVSAEIMKAKTLKNAYNYAQNSYDKEHVTSYIYNNGTYRYFKSNQVRGFKEFRFTIDTIDDYYSVGSLFDNMTDIIKAPVYQLINNFQKMKYRPFYESAIKPMTLGTVQMGLTYGITNKNGIIPKEKAVEIIKQAITEGIEYIDTACSYGNSELVIGEALKNGWGERVNVITKLPYDIEKYDDQKSIKLAIKCAIYKSCLNLNTKKIHTIMLHRACNVLNSSIMDELKILKDKKIVGNIGVSIETPEDLEIVLSKEIISIIQLPFNILDYRWYKNIDKILKEKKKRNLIIHARSSLLQGILVSKDKDLWKKIGVYNYEEIYEWLNSTYKNLETISISDLCIRYVNSQEWIDSVVLGVHDIENLYSNLQSISMPMLNANALNYIKDNVPRINVNSLNPSNWS